jgi:hypothetical protein
VQHAVGRPLGLDDRLRRAAGDDALVVQRTVTKLRKS